MSDEFDYDPLEMVSQACFDYKAALIGMMNSDDTKRIILNEAAAKYQKALKSAIKHMRAELKTVESQTVEMNE